MEAESPERAVPVLDYAPPAQRSLLKIWLVRGGRYLAAATLLGGLAWVLTWLLIPPLFSVVAFVRLSSPTTGITYQASQSAAWQASQNKILSTATTTMTSPAILNAASKKLIGAGSITTTDWAGTSIHAQLFGGAPVIRLDVSHRDPNVANVVASEIVESFVRAQSTPFVLLNRPLAANQIRPERNKTWPLIAAAFGSVTGMIALFLYRQGRSA